MRIVIGYLASLFLIGTCVAQQTVGPRPHVVMASGEATVSAKPDIADITIGIENTAPKAATAVAENAERTSRVLAALRSIVGEKDHVRTSGYTLQPEMVYPHEGEPPRVTGYKATNSVVATMDDLSAIGKAIDAASAAGATAVNDINFRIKDDAAYRLQALGEAATQARARADAMVKALQLNVVGILEARETDLGGIGPIAQPRVMMAAKAAAPTPIVAGNVDVRARVEITLEIR